MPGEEADQCHQVGLLGLRGQAALIADGEREAALERGEERRGANAAPGRDELSDDLLSPLISQVNGDRSFPVVQSRPVQANSLPFRPSADVDAATDWVDSDHVGAERSQGGASQWHRDECGDLDDP